MRNITGTRVSMFILIFAVQVYAICGLLAADLLEEGISHGKAKRYVEAEKCLTEFLKTDPMNEKAHFFLSVSLWQQGKKNPARSEYQLVKSLNAGMADTLERMFPEIAKEEAAFGTPNPDPKSAVSDDQDEKVSHNESYNAGKHTGLTSGEFIPESIEEYNAMKDAELEEEAKNPMLSRKEKEAAELKRLWNAAKSHDVETQAWAYKNILYLDYNNETALKALKDIKKGRGEFDEMRNLLYKSVQAGYITQEECDAEIAEAEGTKLTETEKEVEEVEKLWEETNSDNPEEQESAYRRLLNIDPDDAMALEGLKELKKSQGRYWEMRQLLYRAVKAGHITQEECDDEINEYQGPKN